MWCQHTYKFDHTNRQPIRGYPPIKYSIKILNIINFSVYTPICDGTSVTVTVVITNSRKIYMLQEMFRLQDSNIARLSLLYKLFGLRYIAAFVRSGFFVPFKVRKDPVNFHAEKAVTSNR